MRKLLLFILFLKPLFAENNGEDITRPLNRIDLKYDWQRGVDKVEGSAQFWTLRCDNRYDYKDWQIALRGDISYEYFYCPSKKHCCHQVSCMGDSILQALLIAPDCREMTYAFGMQGILPTAQDHLEVGDGKYQLLPTFAIRWDIDHKGSFLGLVLRQAFDIAGYKNAPHTTRTYIQPYLNLNLPDQWFITLSPECRYWWEFKEWFIPFDMLIGKMLNKNYVVSLEYEYGLVRSYHRFKQQIEFRIGHFF